MERLKRLIRHPAYHAVMALVYVVSTPFVLTLGRNSVLLVLAISVETAVSTHLGAWAAEDAAEDSAETQ